LRQAERASAQNGETLADRMRRAGVLFEFATGAESFETFRPQNESQRAALQLARGFADGGASSLFIHGPAGVGKSHLAAGAIARLIERGENARFLSARRLPLELRQAMEDGIGRDLARLDEYANVRFLALDDLGTAEKSTAFTAESLLSLIDARVQGRRPTFFTSNFPLRDLAPRLCGSPGELSGLLVCDRIREIARVAKLEGESFRGRKGATA
jgi:DNA replication protein DnaC